MEIIIRGHAVQIDDEDLERVMNKSWYVQAEHSANGETRYRVYDTSRQKLPMPRFILGTERLPGLCIDHINRNTLDNRKSNLRVATNSQNQMNRRVSVRNKTGFKGVRRIPSSGRYQAQITKDDELVSLGFFFNAESAAIAYDNAAREMFGDYARLNFPDKKVPTPKEDYDTTTGEKWVVAHKNAFRVSIKATKSMSGYHSKGFKTISEAVEHRNMFVVLSRELPKDGKSYSYKTLPEDIRNKLYKENT